MQRVHPYSAIQLALSLLAIVLLWSLAAFLVFAGLFEGVTNGLGETVPVFMMAANTALAGLLLVPSAVYAFLRLRGRPAQVSPRLAGLRPGLVTGLALLALPLVLLVGYGASLVPEIAWLVLPLMHLLAIGIPVLWLLYLAVRDLPLGSPQRMWGVFGSGLVLGPFLIIIFEMLALVAFVLLGILWIASQPELMAQLQDLALQLEGMQNDPEAALQVLAPYLTSPALIVMVLTFGAVAVPLIEETLKPVGVWLLAGRKLSPAAGFAAGALSGAGYALFESLALSSQSQEWAALVVARIGTGVVHILTTALSGWAISQVFRQRRYLRLALIFLLAVSIHGAWNALTLTSALPALFESSGQHLPLWLAGLAGVAPFGLGLLTLLGFLALTLINRALYRQQRAQQAPPLVAVEAQPEPVEGLVDL